MLFSICIFPQVVCISLPPIWHAKFSFDSLAEENIIIKIRTEAVITDTVHTVVPCSIDAQILARDICLVQMKISRDRARCHMIDQRSFTLRISLLLGIFAHVKKFSQHFGSFNLIPFAFNLCLFRMTANHLYMSTVMKRMLAQERLTSCFWTLYLHLLK